jgi:hypothetical protein
MRRSAPPRLARPRGVSVAAALLVVSAGMTTIGALVLVIVAGTAPGAEGGTTFLLGLGCVGLAVLQLVLAQRMHAGQPWARWLAVVVVLAALAGGVRVLLTAAGAEAVFAGIGVAFYAVLLVCLNTPAVWAWFRS